MIDAECYRLLLLPAQGCEVRVHVTRHRCHHGNLLESKVCTKIYIYYYSDNDISITFTEVQFDFNANPNSRTYRISK